ncbi:hypothetical protein GW17_00021181 [Ensete ventricosum]|nr:hypothetical protein GW17_00021181 [Ensete ventricosum]
MLTGQRARRRGQPDVSESTWHKHGRARRHTTNLIRVRWARPTSLNCRKDDVRLAVRTTDDVVRCDNMISNKENKGLRYEYPVTVTVKIPTPLRWRGEHKLNNQANLIVREVSSGITPDLTFLQGSAVRVIPSSVYLARTIFILFVLLVQRDIYDNLLHAFLKIVLEEGPSELYKGLTPSLIGVMPYAATNYFAYDTLKKLYRKTFKTEEISNAAILLVGSAAGAISSTTTFPLEVAQKHMQVGAVGGRKVYKNMLQVLLSILEKEGIRGLYKGLGPSCMKLVPAAGISFMCYEACKNVLINEAEEDA